MSSTRIGQLRGRVQASSTERYHEQVHKYYIIVERKERSFLIDFVKRQAVRLLKGCFMVKSFSGRVTYANGIVAPNVTVRVFDRDAPGKQDDDLTVAPGLSDAEGRFTVTYDPGRYMDFAQLPVVGLRSMAGKTLRFPDLLDMLLPYLEFRYSVEGIEQVHTEPIELFSSRFTLPVPNALNFLPSRNGFAFANLFSGYMLPFSVPFLSDGKVPSFYGLCGGMSAAACDFLLHGRSVPALEQAPRRGTKLHRYLFLRAMDSFAMGETILRFARWMLLPTSGKNGTYRRSLDEWQTIRALLDQQRLVPIGQLRDRAENLPQIAQRVWNNHQVLAYGYTENSDGSIDLRIYDPNCPKDDTIVMHLQREEVGDQDGEPIYGFTAYEQDCGNRQIPLYGFFAIPYEPVEPPQFREA